MIARPTGPRRALEVSALLALCALVPHGASSLTARPDGGPADPTPDPAPYTVALEHYRSQRFAEAADVIEAAIRAGTADAGHLSLLGWCYVHLRSFHQAIPVFQAALRDQDGSVEARQGLAVALAEDGKGGEAIDLIMRLVDEYPGDEGTAAVLRRVLGAARMEEDRRLSPVDHGSLPAEPRALARAGSRYLEVRHGDRYLPLFIKGINLGVALPGRFPAEFPEDIEIYRRWMEQISDGGMNVIRTYTLLPPVFYQALHQHNNRLLSSHGADSGHPPAGFLWLIQGVWTELPDEDRYDDPAFAGSFREEMERIIDVLHGNILVVHRPGHASGLYRHDVSSMTLAMILGREWEPFSVEAYDSAHGRESYSGKYFSTEHGTAMEAWVASMMDHVVEYEAGRYGVMRPVAFTNWPTLDPLHHPTEATKEEERSLAERLNLPFEAKKVREYDNDGVSVDANRIRPTRLALAGHFASYHAYPYYPDFMNLDPVYAKATDRHGRNNYSGYLRELNRHHEGVPVLISEIGVPTSRGIAHVQPQGFNHGGHNETGQGEVNSRLMETIHDTGSAGGILFAWLDEWFKKNWMVIEFELPAERNPKWLNALDPEQNYGLLAAQPGREHPAVILDGRTDDWTGRSPLAGEPGSEGLEALWAAHDEAYFYIRIDAPGAHPGAGGEIDWDRAEILVGIDTYGREKGDRLFPTDERLEAPTGMEFMVRLRGRESSRVLVDPPYDLFSHRYNRPYRSVPNSDGRYMEIVVETNRKRVGRDGTLFPEMRYSRSPLRFGSTDPAAPGYDALADWYSGGPGGVIEIRLPWGLLNVTDPSSLQVVEDRPDPAGGVGTTTTEGFRLYAAIVDRGTGKILDTVPGRAGDGRIDPSISTLYAWDPWEEPTFHTRLKRSYFILKERLAALPDWIDP